MKTKRRFRAVILIAVLAIVAAACGDSGSDTTTTTESGSGQATTTTAAAEGSTTTAAAETPTTVVAEEPIELTLWSHWGESGKGDWIEATIAAYEEQNPNVTIKVEWYGDKADLYTQLNAANQAGGENAPDIHTVDFRPYGHIPQQQNGWLLDLKGGLDASHWDPGLLGAATYDDGIWGVPIEAFGLWMWYDKTLFSEWGIEIPEDGRVSGELFDEIVAKAAENDMFVVAQGIQNLPIFAAHFPLGMALNDAGIDTMYNAFVTGDLPYNDPALVTALQTAVDRIPGWFNPDVPTLTLTEGAGVFFQHGAAVTVEGSWLPGWLKTAVEDGAAADGFDLGMMRMPAYPGAVDDGAIQWGAGSGWAGSAFTKYPEVVTDFINFASSPENAFAWVEMTDVPTGMVTDIPDSASELVRTQLKWQQDGPTISPALYQTPAGDEEVFFKEGLSRFFSDSNYTAQEFLDEMQRIRESG